MSFRLVPKSVTLNDLERRKGRGILRYFTEFGKPAFQHVTALICGGIYATVYCILYCVYDVVVIVKKVHVTNTIDVPTDRRGMCWNTGLPNSVK